MTKMFVVSMRASAYIKAKTAIAQTRGHGMKVYSTGLIYVSVWAIAFAVAIWLIPTAQFHMVLNLRGGRVANPGKWLIVLPILFVGLNGWSWRALRQHPKAKPTWRDDWGLLAVELVLMAWFTFEQLVSH